MDGRVDQFDYTGHAGYLHQYGGLIQAMLSKRQVPMGRGWLRRYLRDHLDLKVPSNADDDEWQRICDEIPARDWRRLQNAWHQHRHDDSPRYMRYVHAANEESKRLGLFWQRLIAQDFITEEDALLLAENFFQGSGGYSDEKAKDMVQKILSGVADQFRSKTSARSQSRFGRRRTDSGGGSALKV